MTGALMENARYCLCAIVAVAVVCARASVLRDVRFDIPDSAKIFGFLSYGDKGSRNSQITAELKGRRVYPHLIVNTTKRSWGFLTAEIPASEIPEGGEVRLTAWYASNSPDKCRLHISEGVPVGGCIVNGGSSRHSSRYVRKCASVSVVRKKGGFVSVGVGNEYWNENVWMLIDRILVEHLGPGEVSGAEDDVSDYDKVALDEIIRAGVTPEQQEIIQSAEQVLAESTSYDEVSLTAAMAKWQDLKAGKGRVGDIPMTLDEMAQSLVVCRLFPDLTPFSANLRIAPEKARGTLWRAMASQDAHDAALLLIRNRFAQPITCQLRLHGRIASSMRLKRLHRVDGVPDCPVLHVGEGLIELGARETVGFEVVFDSNGLKPNKYRGNIRFEPLDARFPIQDIPVEFEVCEWSMPHDLPVWTCVFDYGKGIDIEYAKMLRSRRINTFCLWLDRKNLDSQCRLLKNLHDGGMEKDLHYFVECPFVRQTGGWKSEHNLFLDRLAKNFFDYGVSYKDWVLHIYDEVMGEEFLRSAIDVHRHNAQVRIYSDAVPRSPAELADFSRAINYWCPQLYAYTSQRKTYGRMLDAMRRSGIPMHVYNCDSCPTQSLALYRLEPWVAWRERLTGIFYWSSIPCWFRAPKPNKPNWGMGYVIDGKYIPSRRWDMWTAGLEDYQLLCRASEVDHDDTSKVAEVVLKNMDLSALPSVIHRSRQKLLEIVSRRATRDVQREEK